MKIQPNLELKRLKNTSLSEKEIAVILGGLLGDGSLKIHASYKNARYAFRHSKRQSLYFYSKCQLLSSISSPGSVQEQKPDGWSKEKKLRFCSKALSALTEIYSITHKKNKLLVRRKWLNHLTAQSLAIWWCDDGSLVSNGRRGVICTDGFSKEECDILVQYLLVVWGVRVRVGLVRGKKKKSSKFSTASIDSPQPNVDDAKIYYRLWLSTVQLQLFLLIILPHLTCAAMICKFAIKYKSTYFQQRWISHLKVELQKRCSDEFFKECEKRLESIYSVEK